MSEPVTTYKLEIALTALKAALEGVTGAGKYFRYCTRGALVLPLAPGIPTPAVAIYLKRLRREAPVWIAEVVCELAFDTGKDADSEFIVASAAAWAALDGVCGADRPEWDIPIIPLGEGKFARSGAFGTFRVRVEAPLSVTT